ncbi:MAG: extracellular solute-binding protein [Armatimonadota bacterium]|nr:extracellular solute-binding protein [Armatimonadota bacterium]MDR7448933.1 extracellular solute-binding protein [Armatimonadota bacterium]MDR7460423.1 extracellular solute-binding protein [Armatimonadota bacterium]MDR7480562.1 extracellular solute-binding protein [Armatimonadota bacterium]MDR7489254.1 extracellular solute-binding protein [Armatimonadota bacterium]
MDPLRKMSEGMNRPVAVLAVAAFIALGTLQAGAGAVRKYEGRTMTVYAGISPRVREDITEYIAPRLKEKFGIELAVEPLGSTVMLEKILAQRARPRVSVAGWDQPVGLQACVMGLCAPIDLAKAPNLRAAYDWAVIKVGGDVKVVATSLIGVGLIYNRDEFARRGLRPPTSWNDLWRDDLRGRISITAPESTWGLAALVMLAKLEGGSEANIEPGFARIKSLLPRLHTIHTWSSELAKLIQLGEVWLGTTGSNMGPALKGQGFPVEWVAPQEGSPVVGGGMSIVANAPYPDVAHEYVNLYFSPEFQVLRARNGGQTPTTRTGYARLSAQEKIDLPLRPLGKLVHLDWATIMQAREGWIERWQREVRR